MPRSRTGDRIAVLATLPTTCGPTMALIRERAALAGAEPEISSEVIDGAFAAVSSATAPRTIGSSPRRSSGIAAEVDVVVLAQASMASAAEAVAVDVPVLTSPRPGVERLAASLARD